MSGTNNPRPTTNDNYIGIEFETVTSGNLNDLRDILKRDFAERNIPGTATVESITYYDIGVECTILTKEKAYKSLVKRFIETIEATGAKVDERCGIHIHIDCRNRDKNVVFNKLLANQTMLFELVAPHRRGGHYCQPSTSSYYSKHTAIHRSYSYDTIEVRMFEATYDTSKVLMWIAKVLEIVNGVMV